MPQKIIYFRADGNSNIGLGHVVRSLALADMLRHDYDCRFLIQNPTLALQQIIAEVCPHWQSLPETTDYAAEVTQLCTQLLQKGDIVVLDHYGIDTNYQRALRQAGCRIVCIDDMHDKHFVADAIINHAGGIAAHSYSREPYTQLYTGLEYALLRRPFLLAAQHRASATKRPDSVFVCLGGADPNNDTLHVLAHLYATTPQTRCTLILGSAYLHRTALDTFLADTPLHIDIRYNLSAADMVAAMQGCRTAITAPSSISLEYLSVGGALYLHQTADNQQRIYDYYLAAQIAAPLAQYPHATFAPNTQPDGLQQARFCAIFAAL